jgi:hypothetical protein
MRYGERGGWRKLASVRSQALMSPGRDLEIIRRIVNGVRGMCFQQSVADSVHAEVCLLVPVRARVAQASYWMVNA